MDWGLLADHTLHHDDMTTASVCITFTSRPLVALLKEYGASVAHASLASSRTSVVAATHGVYRNLTTSRSFAQPPHHPTRLVSAPVQEAEPTVIKSLSSSENPTAWPGLQKKADPSSGGSGAGAGGGGSKTSPFAVLGTELNLYAHDVSPRAESSRAALERERAVSALQAFPRIMPPNENEATADHARLASSSPTASRSQNISNSNASASVKLTASVAPNAVLPRAKASPSSSESSTTKKSTHPAKAFRAKKEALSLTPTAVERLRDLLHSNSGPRLIRIGVRNKGCAGMSYHLEYIAPDQAGKFDERVKQDGVEVLIDSKALFR